jgi:hypothetical protein
VIARPLSWFTLGLLLVPATLAGQASIFGVRGPGFPGRPYSAAAIGTGGSIGLFDPQSQLSPASLATLQTGAACFTLLGDFRSVETPAGSARTRGFRFPNIFITAPFRRGRYAFGIGATTYADRDFTLAIRDSVRLRDSVVTFTDTSRSRGGLSDLQLAFALRTIPKTTLGFAAHLITGTDRLVARRAFDDTSYATVLQFAELSTTAFGLSVGATREINSKVTLSALIRKDFTATVNVDSALYGGATNLGTDYGLPWTFAGGALLRATPLLQVAVQGTYRTWSAANSSLVNLGAPGSTNTLEVSVGGELTSRVRRTTQFPLRVGLRYATLPFFVSNDPSIQPKEFALSVGTGVRFAKQRGGIDVSLERVWRSASGKIGRAHV